MSDAADKVKQALLELTDEERFELADYLGDLLPAPPGTLRPDDPGFDAELDRRREAFESGRSPGV